VPVTPNPDNGPSIFEILEKNYKESQIKNEILTKINLDNGKIIYELHSKISKLEKNDAIKEVIENNSKELQDTIDLINYKQNKKNENYENYIKYQNEICNKLARTLFSIRAIVSTVDTSVLVPKENIPPWVDLSSSQGCSYMYGCV
jgi:hypothetical protein